VRETTAGLLSWFRFESDRLSYYNPFPYLWSKLGVLTTLRVSQTDTEYENAMLPLALFTYEHIPYSSFQVDNRQERRTT